MKKSAILCVAAGLSCGVANAGGPVGPDVIVGDMPSIQYYGQVGTIRAYSVATTSCNIGDTPLEWFDGTNRHPVIGQTMYRVNAEGTRIEQLGQSWLKHGFAALTGNVCDTCQNPGSFSLLLGPERPAEQPRHQDRGQRVQRLLQLAVRRAGAVGQRDLQAPAG